MDWIKDLLAPVAVVVVSTGASSLIMWAIRRAGKGAASELAFRRTILTATSHQNGAIRTVLQVQQGAKINGNVHRALGQLDEADKVVQEYLMTTATGGK